jgi:PAS domain S-box-containing protein
VEGGKIVANERILVVDDQPLVAQTCADILAEAGYRVYAACGGREALDCLERERFDLLVADLKMPGVDGLTVLRRARGLHPGLAAVMITSYATMENAIEALRAGAQDFLLKPFDPDDLLRSVSEALAAVGREATLQVLRQKEQQLSSIYDNVSDVLFYLAVEPEDRFRFVSVNKVFLQATGLAQEQIIGKDFRQVIPEPAHELALGKYQEAIRERRTATWEEISVYPAGKKYGEVSVTPVFDAAGHCTHLVGTVHDVTERHATQERIRASEERYRAFFENSMDAILLTSPDGSIQAANPAACRMFERTEAEIIQAGRAGVVDTSDPRLANLLAERAATGRARGELTMLRRDGTPFPAEVSSAVFQDSEGIWRTSMTIRDITEHKRAEEALKESVGRWSSLVDNAPNLIAILDRNGVFQFVNRTVPGLTVEEVIGTKTYDYILLECHDVVREKIEHVFDTGEAVYYELQGIGPHGETRWYETRVGPLIIDGQIAYVTQISSDITERKRAEEALRESEEKYRQLFEVESDALFMLSRETAAIMEVNNAAVQLYQYSRDELLKTNGIELSAEPEKSRPMMSDTSGRISIRYHRKKDGTIFPVEILFSDFDYRGQPMRMVTVRDITEGKRAEEELRRRAEELAALNRSARQLAQSLDLDTVAENITRTCVQTFGARLAWLLHAEPDSSMRHIKHFPTDVTYPAQVAIRWDDSPLGRGPTGRAVRSGEPVVFADLATIPDYVPWREAALSEGFVTSVALPLICGGSPLGALNLYSDQPGFFSVEQVGFFQTFASQAAAALENARLFEQVRVSRERVSAEYIHANESGEPLDTEYRVVTPDGRTVWIRDEAILKRDQSGQPLFWQGIMLDITEGKEAEKEIRQLSQFLDSVIDNANVWLNVLDGKANVVMWNKAAEEISGYSREEVVGHSTVWRWLYPDEAYRNTVLAEANALIERGGQEQDTETIIRRKDGQTRTISWNSRGVVDENGTPAGSIALGRDITERKRAEEALRRAEERYRNLFEDAPVMYVITHNQEGTPIVAECNGLFLSRLGYRREQVLGRPLADFYTPQSQAELLPGGGYQRALEGSFTVEERQLVTRDGQVIHTLLHASPESDAAGHALGTRAAFVDISPRKRAEAELRRLKEFNEGIIHNMAEGILVEDAGGTITFVNPAAAAMLGHTPEELVGQPWTTIVPPDQQPIVQAADARRARGQTDRYEVELACKDGARLPVLFSTGPRLSGDTGGFAGILAVFTDLSDFKRLEEQFRQAQKMEAVGRLAGGVAHDFNNLLTVIHLSTRLLEKKLRPDDPLWPHVQRIQDAGQRAASLTKQLLAFSRREIIEPKVLDLSQVLGDLEKMLRRLIREDIELSTILADDLWPVKADPTQVEQIVVNLAVNARDAMPTSGKLTIETANVVLDAAYAAAHLEVEPGEYVLLAVSDTGTGMSDEVKAHLFEPFFTTKERGRGTGLGLATVFGIVKQNRGHVWVYSEVGQGTTFKIYLPRAGMPRVVGGAQTPSDRPTEAAAPPARGSETLLLVEDETGVRELTKDILLAQGYRVLVAQDGVEALQVAQEHEGPIHLLITDMVMPRLGGRELADQLRSSRPKMRVLYTSGYTDNAIVHHGVLDEGVVFLSKPFELEALAHKVRDVLDGGDQRADGTGNH